jgi:hypothetical protein
MEGNVVGLLPFCTQIKTVKQIITVTAAQRQFMISTAKQTWWIGGCFT